MDDIFYKVIHNKYLFNLIFFHLESHHIKFNKNDSFKPEQYNYKNKIKFKDIISLEWMVNKKEFNLLKCKLEANEPILLDYNLKWFEKLDDLKIQQEYLSLFFKNNKINFMDFISENIVYLNQDLVLTLLLPPYSIEVTKSMVLLSFEKSSKVIIYLLLNYFISGKRYDEIEDFKKNSIIYVFHHSGKKQFQKDMVFEIIFSNNKFYSSCLAYPDIDKILFEINSISIKNKLMNYKFYNIPSSLSKYKIEINQIINIYTDTERLKLLIDFINLRVKNGDVFISTKYQSFEITPSNKIVENLKYFLENNKYDWKNIRYNLTINLSKLLDIECFSCISNDFIKYYLSLEQIKEYSYFIITNFDNYLTSKIKFSFFKEPELLLKIMSEIEVVAPNNRVTSKFYKILNKIEIIDGYFIVSDEETIEQIFKIDFPKNSFQALNLNILEYIEKRKEKKIKDQSIGYDYWLKKTLQSLDFKEIITYILKIHSYNHLNTDIKCINGIIKYLQSKINRVFIKKILEFLPEDFVFSENIFKNRKNEWLDYFMDSLKTYNLNIIKLLINNNFHSILYDEEILNNELEKLNIEKTVFYFCDKNVFFSTLKISEKTIDSIISIIKLLINDFKKNVKPNKIQTSKLEIIINWLYKTLIKISNISFEKVADVYFFILESDTITLEHSKYHSIYYLSIKSIKCIKYIMELPYFKDIGIYSKDQIKYYGLTDKYDMVDSLETNLLKIFEKEFGIKKYLNEEIFTFDFIFGKVQKNSTNGVYCSTSSFEKIINQLINGLSYSRIKNNNSYYNYNLKYYLDILRSDLFLKEIQYYINNKSKIKFMFDPDLFNILKNSIFQNEFNIITKNQSIKFQSFNNIKLEIYQIYQVFSNDQFNSLDLDFYKITFNDISFIKNSHFIFDDSFSNINQFFYLYLNTINMEEKLINCSFEFIKFILNKYPDQKNKLLTDKFVNLAILSKKFYLLKSLMSQGLIIKEKIEKYKIIL